ncbi:Xylosidase [Madurella fahalii]|uniref:Xylosidase n=1 Tax=Madurella fahalii TaxID=1157608 RepID=A0ABQ0GNL9_9PEZI
MHAAGVRHILLLGSQLAATTLAVSLPVVGDHTITPRADTLTNPVLWQDYPDLEVIRVGNAFYYSSSKFAYSPGAPVLKSYDLANWEPVTHSVPVLNFGNEYNLDGSGSAYVKGIWASTLQYRQANDMFYWMGCINSGKTYIWTAAGTGAARNGGEVANWTWTSHPPIDRCYYDCGLLIDDDDPYTSQEVYVHSGGTIEGSRMYKINGYYYIWVTRSAYEQWVLRSRSPFGPYERRRILSRISGPIANAGVAHQGAMVNAPDNRWYYVAFMDAYPGGRIPVVAPLTWTADGWPELVTAGGSWGRIYPIPVQTNKTVAPPVGTDGFKGTSLSHEWEWNHNPDNTKWQLAGDSDRGLILRTADVTADLFLARNTLTRRIIGPKSSGTFCIDVSKMVDGDRAGAALFRDRAAYIGVWNEGAASRIVMVNRLTLSEGSWRTVERGTVAATGPTLGGGITKVWLRIEADITPATDGVRFTGLGPAFGMTNSYRYFSGYRYAVFNHATRQLGGEVKVLNFTMALVN